MMRFFESSRPYFREQVSRAEPDQPRLAISPLNEVNMIGEIRFEK